MYANLLGQKAIHKLTDKDMGNIIGISRTAYNQKIKTGKFSPVECKAYCKYFNRPFDYLFATDDDIPTTSGRNDHD